MNKARNSVGKDLWSQSVIKLHKTAPDGSNRYENQKALNMGIEDFPQFRK